MCSVDPETYRLGYSECFIAGYKGKGFDDFNSANPHADEINFTTKIAAYEAGKNYRSDLDSESNSTAPDNITNPVAISSNLGYNGNRQTFEVQADSKEKFKKGILIFNKQKGRIFEQREFAKFSKNYTHAVEQITIKTSTGIKTRVDAIGINFDGSVVIYEFKSSATAPLTKNQKRAFSEIYESGGIVLGKGKGIFISGYKLPKGTKVTIIRPSA